MKARRKRLDSLEAARRQWEREHLPLSEVLGLLGAVLQIVQQEAGQDAFRRVAGRIVGQKARKVDTLTRARGVQV